MKTIFLSMLSLFALLSCAVPKKQTSQKKTTFTYLALGDSYTIGESVCNTCNYPRQLTDSLNKTIKDKTSIKIIAKTGWTTSDLQTAIVQENPSRDYDLVTLLIGVNNQYQGKPFSVYKEEFPALLDMAIKFAKGNPKNVIVISIPDYGFTPFGEKSGKAKTITEALKIYNRYAEKIAIEKNVHFENITPITQQGILKPTLVAIDGLHPSEEAYKLFVAKIFKKALHIIN